MMRPTSLAILGLVGSLAGGAGCGRSTVFECALGVAPSALDFGSVPAGTTITRSLMVSSLANNGCYLSSIAIGAGSDPGFTPGQSSLGIDPETEMPLTVTFTPGSGAVHAAGTLVLESSDPDGPSVSIPLKAKVVACDLTAPDGGVDFATLAIGEANVQTLTLTNPGLATCNCSATLNTTSDPGFSLPTPQQISFALAPGGQATLAVQFETGADVPPTVRTGTLALASNTPGTSILNVPLRAYLPGCNLQASPPVLNFGNIPAGGSATDSVTGCVNDGGLECDVRAASLVCVWYRCRLLAATPRRRRSAFRWAERRRSRSLSSTRMEPIRQTPMPARSTSRMPTPACRPSRSRCRPTSIRPASPPGRYIYVLDEGGVLARFDPTTLSITNIAHECRTAPTAPPHSRWRSMRTRSPGRSMSPGNLYRIDTSDASCESDLLLQVTRPLE